MMFTPRLLILLITIPVLILLEIQHLHLLTDPSSFSSWIPDGLRPSSWQRPRVQIAQGTLLGSTIAENLNVPVEAFRGIPYAVPPVGERRFRRAEAVPAPERVNGDGDAEEVVIDAGRLGKRCPGKQLIPLKGDTGSDEDCLTVNVFRPKGVTDKDKVPVAVYIHGGAYNRGSALMHNTASMVGWSAQPFVGVSFNYRIGALGFLPSSTTAKEGVLNLGLHDQLLLLQWVQDNVASFGGDPSQVTLFGVSAGAHSIAHHIMNTDLHHSLFHRAIIESGAATSRAVHPIDSALHEAQFRQFVEASHCDGLPDSEIFPCLRTQPIDLISNASSTVFDRYNPSVRWAFQPVIDNELIKRRPIDAWNSGDWNKMPILTGFNSNEGTYYVPVNMSTSQQFRNFFHTLLPAYTEQDLDTIDALYPDPETSALSPYIETRPIAVGSQYKRVEAAYGHYAYACPVRQTAHFASLDPGSNENPVFLYRWALNKTVQGGANHADQLPYETYDVDVRGLSEAQEEVAGQLHAYFTSFIVTGDPNAIPGRFSGRPRWERYVGEEGEGKAMVFGEGNDERAGGTGRGVAAKVVDDEWSRRECEFWWTKAGLSD